MVDRRREAGLGTRLVRAYVEMMFAVASRGLVAVSRTDPEARSDLDGLPEGFVFEMKVLPAGPSFRVRKVNGTLRPWRGGERPHLSIQWKHLRHAFRVFAFLESTPRAVANNRVVVDG